VYSVLRKQRVPFSIGYWGTIFPNGVFALLTVELGSVLGSPVLNYLGAIFSGELKTIVTVCPYLIRAASRGVPALGLRLCKDASCCLEYVCLPITLCHEIRAGELVV
jgi:tellurite resistance protein TehA-like permease